MGRRLCDVCLDRLAAIWLEPEKMYACWTCMPNIVRASPDNTVSITLVKRGAGTTSPEPLFAAVTTTPDATFTLVRRPSKSR